MTRGARMAMVVLPLGLVCCVPWTVRPIDAEKQDQSSAPAAAQNPVAYVDSIWNSKLLPAILSSAVDSRTLLDALKASPSEATARYARREANGPALFIVKGEGVVTSVDTRSRAGLALLDIAPFDKRADVSVQIGPVIRGTSLRDATGTVRFTDFVNQLQFADAGNELNERVLKTVLAPLDRQKLKGRTLSFIGTLAAVQNAEVPLPELVPVKLELKDAR